MSISDANKVPANSILKTEICVAGAGAAGITLAHELNGSRQSVCLAESGNHNPDEDAQSLYDIDVAGYPIRENFMSRARYFGGTCNLWAGRSVKLTEFDFEKREWIPNSGWPIAYSELQNYYGRAAEILKLPLRRFREQHTKAQFEPSGESSFDNDALKPNISLIVGVKPLRFGAAYKSRLARSRNVTVYPLMPTSPKSH